jgi:hypothetical protein
VCFILWVNGAISWCLAVTRKTALARQGLALFAASGVRA